MDNYQSIQSETMAEFKDKGSRFIAYAYPFQNEEQLKPIIEKLKSDHPKARHHCFAYKIGLNEDRFRAFDDGEPSGTAGKPIYNTLLSKGFSDILIVVVRYFGGTLLGVPGLINAYKNASIEVLNQSELITKYIYGKVKVDFDFENLNSLMRIVKEKDLKIIAQNYEIRNSYTLEIRKGKMPEVIESLESYRCFEITELE